MKSALDYIRQGSTWTPAVARALHALAESNPTPEEYKRKRAEIIARGGK